MLSQRFLLSAFLGLAAISPHVQAQNIAIDPAKVTQDFEGWGISLCWWGHQVGRWTDANLTPLIDIVVNPDTGLGYTIFRYNIGGGDNPAHTHLNQYKALPGYKKTETGAYDWTADPYQRKVAQMLQTRGKNTLFEAFSNSPPWWMTKNQCSAGMQDGSDNLKPEYFEAFADYLTEVTKHLQDDMGFRFRTIAPLNEPTSNWWTGTSQSQEGCGFTNNQPRLIKLLAQKIKAKNLSVGISTADETSIALAVSGLAKYDDSALSVVSQLNTHSYNGWEKRKDYGALAAKYKKTLWMSETGPLNKPSGGDQLDVALWMADVIIRDIKEMKANAWVDWQLIDVAPAWRSIDANQTAQTFKPNKRFYMHCNFSRFIRPGAKILESTVVNTLVAQVPETGNLVVVILNPDNAAKSYTPHS
jgi:O-glycosyl hydrolase